MSAHFVVKQTFNGEEIFAVEFSHSCKRASGQSYEHACYEISDATAARPLNELIDHYKAGIRPKKPLPQSKKD
jgi:hypothetical protein